MIFMTGIVSMPLHMGNQKCLYSNCCHTPLKWAEVGDLSKDDKIMYIFSYLLTWLSGIIVYILYSEKDRNLRFHAVQSILLGIIITIIGIFSAFLFFPVSIFTDLFAFLLYLYGIYVGYKAYTGVNISIPVIGDMAK